jgi:predicted small metal-binding protein
MYRLDCPVDSCQATIEAETAEEVVSRAAGHAGEQHPELELDQSTVAELKAEISQV